MVEIKIKRNGKWIRWDGENVDEFMLSNWETKKDEIVSRDELIKRYPEQWKFCVYNYQKPIEDEEPKIYMKPRKRERRLFRHPYRKGYSLLEWILLNLDKCPVCTFGYNHYPHRNCILR